MNFKFNLYLFLLPQQYCYISPYHLHPSSILNSIIFEFDVDLIWCEFGISQKQVPGAADSNPPINAFKPAD